MKTSHYNKKLKGLSRKLRNDSTPGEIKLWNELLKNRQFYGYQFNRQFVMGNYIVDFICRKLKLAVEVDGYSHDFTTERDQQKDAFLTSKGYKVVRILEQEVMKDFTNVISVLESYLPDNEVDIDYVDKD